MIQTAIVEARVTADNVDEFRDAIQSRAQQREIKVDDVISHFRDDSDATEVTIWHNQGRAAVCYYNGESEWGNWNEQLQTITLDEPDWDGSRVTLDRYGQPHDKAERS
jgi:hypothetical protein